MTPQFFMIWMLSSAVTFFILANFTRDVMNTDRGYNTACVLISQAIGAMVAYALY